MKHIETKTSLVAHLQGAGVKPGDTLFVHTSLSKLGWVCGGAQTVIEALQDTVGTG